MKIIEKRTSSRSVGWIGVSVCIALISLCFIPVGTEYGLNLIELSREDFCLYLEFILQSECKNWDSFVEDRYLSDVVWTDALWGFRDFIFIFLCVFVVLVHSVIQLYNSYRPGALKFKLNHRISLFLQRHKVIKLISYCVFLFVSFFLRVWNS